MRQLIHSEKKLMSLQHKKEKADLIRDRRTIVKALKKVVSDKTKTVDKLSLLVQDLENNENPTPVLTDAAVQVPVLPLKVHDVGVQVPVVPLQVHNAAVQVPDVQAALGTEAVLVEAVGVKLVPKSWNDVLEWEEKNGIRNLPSEWIDSGGLLESEQEDTCDVVEVVDAWDMVYGRGGGYDWGGGNVVEEE